MGRKLDALLGRSFKPSKLKGTARLAVSRLPALKTIRQGRCSIARSDVVEFLKTGNQDRALLRVEQVVMEQNVLDVLVALEGYCHLLVERVNLFEQEKYCPDELIEAVSTLIYASTRCGDFPELLELRAIFTSKFGKEFVLRAVELRNNCGVNPRIIQKLSTRMPSLENKMEVLKEIALENNIEIKLPTSHTKLQEEREKKTGTSILGVGDEDREIERGQTSTPRRKYRDVADAAQAAFESAAYAAEAARMAVELSRSESSDPDNPTTPRNDDTKSTDMKFEKIHPVILNHDLENKGMEECLKPNDGIRKSFSSSSSDEEEGDVKGKLDVVFDESDDDLVKKKKTNGSGVEPLNINRRPISVRSKWPQGPPRS